MPLTTCNVTPDIASSAAIAAGVRRDSAEIVQNFVCLLHTWCRFSNYGERDLTESEKPRYRDTRAWRTEMATSMSKLMGSAKPSPKRRVTDHPVFADLVPAELKLLRKAAQQMYFPQNATIQTGGQVDRRCFVVFDGLVELSDGETSIDCGPGGVFGDAGSYGRAIPATAVALTNVRTFVIPSLVMANLVNSNPRLAARLTADAAETTSIAG